MSLERLKQAVAASNITIVAEKIGVSRTALSLVINGKYPADAQKLIDRFELEYSNVDCPFAQRELTRQDCRQRSTAPRPFGGAAKAAWWNACQTCIYKA